MQRYDKGYVPPQAQTVSTELPDYLRNDPVWMENQRIADGRMTPEETAMYQAARKRGDKWLGVSPSAFLEHQQQWKNLGLDKEFGLDRYTEYWNDLTSRARQAGLSSTEPSHADQYDALRKESIARIKSTPVQNNMLGGSGGSPVGQQPVGLMSNALARPQVRPGQAGPLGIINSRVK